MLPLYEEDQVKAAAEQKGKHRGEVPEKMTPMEDKNSKISGKTNNTKGNSTPKQEILHLKN